MNNIQNPFLIKRYESKTFFCDRENELNVLLRNVNNGIDTTLVSPRRMGKTGLIMRFFEQLNEKNHATAPIYIDIYASRSLNDFVKLFAESILKEFPEKTGTGAKFMKILKGFRPLISYDAISGEPQINITYNTPQEKEYTLKELLLFLDKQNKHIVLAIDEFQQICDYPEKNMEALLRTYTQQLKNIRFVFCGSKKSIMTDIFSNAKRPFFASTQFMSLDKIDEIKYTDFIKNIITLYKKTIDDESINFILQWSKRHTFYTQSVCNMTFALSEKKIKIDTVKNACLQLLIQNEPVFLQYRQLLTYAQWNFLIAVAKEEEVNQITSQKFINSYNIGTPANSRRIAKSLIEKELILAIESKKNITYMVYDVFLSRWLQHEY